MMGFNLDNYESVKDRISRFYIDHPEGRILTELVNEPGSLVEFAAFKASAYIGENILKATGYAMEQQGQGVNKDAWVENAETSAIGRALANMDYAGTLRPSKEEMGKVGNPPHEISSHGLPTDDRIKISLALEEFINSGAIGDGLKSTISAKLSKPETPTSILASLLETCKGISK
jgi:hypothetical protein